MAIRSAAQAPAARAHGRVGERPAFERLAFAAVVCLALAVRAAVALTIPHYHPLTDSADFDRIAVALARHGSFPSSVVDPAGGPTAFRPPAFPLLLAAVYRLVGTADAARRWQAGLLAEALLGAAVVWLTLQIARRLWGPWIALVCGLVAALWPPLVMVGASLMSEPLFIALELGAVLAALRARDSRHPLRWALASGVLCGAAALARGNGIALAVPLAFLVWVARPRLSRRALRAPLVLVAAMIVTVAPWTIRNALVLHRLVPVTSEAGYALAGTYNRYAAAQRRFPDAWVPPVPEELRALARNPHLNEAALSDRLLGDALAYIRHHPGYVAGVLYHNTLRTLDLTGTAFERFAARYEVYPTWLVAPSVDAFLVALVLALVALVSGAGGLVGRAPPAFWCVPLVVLASVVFIYGGARYRSPADPFVIMLAVVELTALARSARWRARRRWVMARRALPSARG